MPDRDVADGRAPRMWEAKPSAARINPRTQDVGAPAGFIHTGHSLSLPTRSPRRSLAPHRERGVGAKCVQERRRRLRSAAAPRLPLSDSLLARELRLGRRSALTFPVLPPPQKN